MKRYGLLPAYLAALVAAAALSGCAGLKTATPQELGSLVDSLAAAGCSGTITVSIGAGSGQLGGGAQFSNTFSGSCDPAKAKPKGTP